MGEDEVIYIYICICYTTSEDDSESSKRYFSEMGRKRSLAAFKRANNIDNCREDMDTDSLSLDLEVGGYVEPGALGGVEEEEDGVAPPSEVDVLAPGQTPAGEGPPPPLEVVLPGPCKHVGCIGSEW